MLNDLSVWNMVLDASPDRSSGDGAAAVRLGGVLGHHFPQEPRDIALAPGRRPVRERSSGRAAICRTLYRKIETKGREGTGLQSIFESGFGEFSRLRQQGTPADLLLEGARRAMRVAQMREIDRLETKSRHPRHGRLDQSLRGPVRHRVGHHECLPQSRQRAAGHARGGRAGHRRGVDRHRHRLVRGDSGGGGLQPIRRSGEPAGTSLRYLRRRVLDHTAAPRSRRVRKPEACPHRCAAAN